MTIKTALKEIPLKGIALMAGENIKKGQVIYKDDPTFDKLISDAEFQQLSPLMREFVRTYAAYSDTKKGYYLCCDNARFFNHSESPNTHYILEQGIVIALCDIPIGTELSSDYREFCDSCKQGDWGFDIV